MERQRKGIGKIFFYSDFSFFTTEGKTDFGVLHFGLTSLSLSLVSEFRGRKRFELLGFSNEESSVPDKTEF